MARVNFYSLLQKYFLVINAIGYDFKHPKSMLLIIKFLSMKVLHFHLYTQVTSKSRFSERLMSFSQDKFLKA